MPTFSGALQWDEAQFKIFNILIKESVRFCTQTRILDDQQNAHKWPDCVSIDT